MMIEVDQQAYILPMDGIRELVANGASAITEMSNGQEVINVRGKLLPVLDMAHALGGRRAKADVVSDRRKTVVVVEVAGRALAVRVDALLGQTQVVLKPLGFSYQSSGNGSRISPFTSPPSDFFSELQTLLVLPTS
ncbi:chemotaxis protein CheW [Bdellovibrionota bacterium FG-2]